VYTSKREKLFGSDVHDSKAWRGISAGLDPTNGHRETTPETTLVKSHEVAILLTSETWFLAFLEF
jgi:hypothetical protein